MNDRSRAGAAASRAGGRRLGVPEIAAASAFAIWLGAALLPFYGFFIDELYYVACSYRLDWGYVDHPPLSILLLRVSRALLGDGRLALRLPATLAGAATVWLAARLARRLGAGPLGQALAGGGILAAPVFGAFFGFYSMNAYEPLVWLALAAILVELEMRNEPRLWLVFGVVAGIGLENKHTTLIFALGLAVGLLLTPARRHLASRWLWLGGAIAVALLLPNLIWQAAHGWPSLEFYRNADLYKNVPTPPLQVLLQQALFTNPGTVPLWIAGAVFLLRRREGIDLRHLGWIYVALLAMMLVGQKSRPDRIAGIYPLLLAAGGAALDAAARTPRRRWLRFAAPAWLVAWGLILAPFCLPILPPETLSRYLVLFGGPPQMERGEGKRTPIPQVLADRLGWERLVEDVAAAVDTLTPDERKRAVAFAPAYGPAGAIEWLGRDRGLPPVYCGQNTYYLWGPPPDPVDVAIVLGDDDRHLGELFEQVELAGIHECGMCMPWRNQMPIWIVRGAKVKMKDLWPVAESRDNLIVLIGSNHFNLSPADLGGWRLSDSGTRDTCQKLRTKANTKQRHPIGNRLLHDSALNRHPSVLRFF